MKIKTVKKIKENYLVNGNKFVYSNSADIRDQDEHKEVLAWIKNGGVVEHEDIEDNTKRELSLRLQTIHSLKVQQIQKVITSKTFTRELENEYNTKAVEAVKALESNDFSFFELSAQLKGVTSKQYAELVVAKSQQMHDVEKQALRKIGDIRSFISDLIDSKKFFQAQKMIDYIEEVKPETIIGVSNEQLVELIQTYSN